MLPLFVAVWIAGMTVFQAPALAIVRDVSAPGEVSSAMVPVILATTVPIACWPLVETLLQGTGGSRDVPLRRRRGRRHRAARSAGLPDVARDLDADATPEPPGGLRAFACGIASAVTVLLATDRVPAAMAAAAAHRRIVARGARDARPRR